MEPQPPPQPRSPAAPRRLHASFNTAAAIAACRVEEVMAMPAEQLARVAWPLLTNAARGSAMRDVLFHPPIRVSASPRATEASFAAGIHTCVSELSESLAQTDCGEEPLSTAQLRAAALTHFVVTPYKAAGGRGGSPASTRLTAPPSPPRRESHMPSALTDIFDFALPSVAVEPGEHELHDLTSGTGSARTSRSGSATVAPPLAAGMAGGLQAVGGGAAATSLARVGTIKPGSTNRHDNAAGTGAGGAGGSVTSGSGSASPSAAALAGRSTADTPILAASAPGERAGKQACYTNEGDVAYDRESFERKTRRFLAERLDIQWESVVANALVVDNVAMATATAPCSTSAPTAAAAAPLGCGGAFLRQKMLRTAVVLCQRAPASTEAGHSFACLLKHALRATSTTDAIRGSDGGPATSTTAPLLHSPPSLSPAAHATQRSPPTPAQLPPSVAHGTPSARTSEEREAHGPVKPTLPPPTATLPLPQHTPVAQQQAALWVEVVLPLLHLVPIVQWTHQTTVELGQILETVTAMAPAKLVAMAQLQHAPLQQHQLQQQRLHDARTPLQPAQGPPSHPRAKKTAGSASGSHVVMHRRPASQPRKGGAAAAAATGAPRSSLSSSPSLAPSVAGVGGAAETVHFTVRVPFEIGVPVPPAITEAQLSELVQRAGPGAGSEGAAPPTYTSESGHSTGNHYPSYPSSAFHEVPDVRDAAANVTEEMSVVDEEEEDGSDGDSAFTDAEDEYAYEASSSHGSATSSPTHASRASALNISTSSRGDGDEAGSATAGAVGDGVMFTGARGDFEALPCRLQRTEMVELCLPGATRVSVQLAESVEWARASRGRDVLLLPLESDAVSAERAGPLLAEAPTSLGGRRGRREAQLPLLYQSLRDEPDGVLAYSGPCRVAIPSLAQEPVYMLPGEVCAHVQLALDTRWSNEWTVALSSAQRTVAERLLTWMEHRLHTPGGCDAPQRCSRVAGSILLRGGLKGTSLGSTVPAGVPATAEPTGAAIGAAAAATASGTAGAAAPTALSDPFTQALLDMPVPALRARVRCHTVHADGVRATLLVIAHVLLQDRAGYLRGDPLSWHTPAWTDAVRRVSLASTAVGSANAGERATEVALFVVRHVAAASAASTAPAAQVVDAAIELFSIPGLSVADIRAALEERRQLGSTMWVVVDLLTKCSVAWRAPRHVALVSLAARRLLLLGSTAAATGTTATAAAATAAATGSAAHSTTHASSAVTHTPSHRATGDGAGAALASSAAAGHYLGVVGGCGRATEANLRRGVRALLAHLLRLLRALLHRVQSTQAAPHRFLLEPWEYGAFAVLTISLLATPMDAADMHVCAPHFAEVVTGLLPSFTHLTRTESLLLTSETAEQEFLVEVAKYVRGRAPPTSAAAGGSADHAGAGAAEPGDGETPVSREPHLLRRYQETANGSTVTSDSSMPSLLGEGGSIWDIPHRSASASWTPGHVRVELWNGSSRGFFLGLASTDVPLSDCVPEKDPNGIYFMGDGTVQYGDVTRRQRRLPRWHAGDVVELSFVFGRGGWDAVLSLNGVSLTRLTLPRRDFRLVATNVRGGSFVPGRGHVHVLSIEPVHGRSGRDATVARRRGKAASRHAGAARPPLALASASPDVRLSPFAHLTLFSVSLLLELVLHYLVLRSTRHARSVAAVASAEHAEGPSLVQACTAPLQHSVQQLLHLLQELGTAEGDASGGDAMDRVKRTAARRVTNAMLLDLVVTLSIAVPASPVLLSTHVDVLTAVAECAAVARKTRSVALSALYNAISHRASGAATGGEATAASVPPSPAHPTYATASAAAPVSPAAARRLWAACHRLASLAPGYQPRFSSVSVPSSCVVVLAGGRRIEHTRAGSSAGLAAGAGSGSVRSMSYACNPIDLADPHTPDIVRVSVRVQRGFQCETLGRYYYFGLAELNAPLAATTLDSHGELTMYPGELSKQRRVYFISDYLTEVPGTAVQRWDVERERNYLNPETGIVFGSGDVITAVVYVKERCVGFERNGLPLNILHRGIPSSVRHLHPFVELYNRDSRAKWMYAPDEAVISARYTMRAMLLSWTALALPLVRESLPRLQRPDGGTPGAAESAAGSCSAELNGDVTLGVLGADGDEAQVVYVAPPQQDQPGGRATPARVERFEGCMVVVSDEAGSLQRVCAAALEPNSTKEPYTLPGAPGLRACVQACVPELAALAAQCLASLAPSAAPASYAAVVQAGGDATRRRRLTLQRPATLLRALRLIFCVHGALASRGGAMGPPHHHHHQHHHLNANNSCSATSSQGLGDAASIAADGAGERDAAAAGVDAAMQALLPLLDAVLPATHLNLPSQTLLREAWNELGCNPYLREQHTITVPGASAGDGDAAMGEGREAAATYTEPAGATLLTGTRRFEARIAASHQRRGDALLCPTCGLRWSACTARHPVPASWCDLLDRILRRLQQRSGPTSLPPAPQQQRQQQLPRLREAARGASPYCGWYADWTDAPLTAGPEATPAVSTSDAAAAAASASVPGSATVVAAAAAAAAATSTAGADDEDYRSPTSAQSSDAMLWEDADDEDDDSAPSRDDYSIASGAEETASDVADDGDGDGDAAASRAAAGKEAEAPMTLTVRPVNRRGSASLPASSSSQFGGSGDADDRVLVEGSGETKVASFTFSGYLVSPTLLRGRMEFGRAEPPDGDSADAATTQEWACTLCTYLNEPAAVRCAMCATARPGASWTCPTCSFAYNSLAAATCMTCGSMRPSGVRRQETAGLCTYCTTCHQREYVRDFQSLRYRHYCSSCARVTRWLPKDRFCTTIEARLVGDGATLEFQWALDGVKMTCFGLHTRAYSADLLWDLVDAAARRTGSTAAAEVSRYVAPIPERPLTADLAAPLARASAASAALAAAAAAAEPCMTGALVHYASAIVLRHAALLPPRQLCQPAFLRRIHVCSTDWLDSWADFPAALVTPVFYECLRMLEDGIQEPALVSTVASVALALIRQQPAALAAERDALLYALCMNVVRHGDAAQRKASYACLSALMEDHTSGHLNAQPLLPALSMEPLVEGQQRATVLALLHRASMRTTSAMAKASACLARTVAAMERRRALPPMLGEPFPYVVALTDTRLNEAGELLVGQVRGSVGVAPNKGGKYYYEVEVPQDFMDRTRTVVMGWGTLEHERISSAQHVGSDMHSWGYNCRDHLRLMMTEQAMPVPRRPSVGDVIGSMMDLETMMVCWTINGQEISWVSVPAQGDGEEIYPYVSASVEPRSLKIRLGHTQFKPPGYEDYSPPSDSQLWGSDADDGDDEAGEAGATRHAAGDAAVAHDALVPQTYEFYQQLSRALEEASITSLEASAVLTLLDTPTAHSVLRRFPLLTQLAGPQRLGRLGGSPASAALRVRALLPYIQQLRCAQELTIVVARHLRLIEKSPYLMTCYRKATDLLFSSGRWTIFELQPGGRPKYSGGHAFRVLVSLRKANQVRAEADAAWIAEHPALLGASAPSSRRDSTVSAVRYAAAAAAEERPSGTAAFATDLRGGDDDVEDDTAEAEASDADGDFETEEDEDFVDVMEDEDADAEEGDDAAAGGGDGGVGNADGTLREGILGDTSALTLEERLLRCSVTGQLFTQLEQMRVFQRARMFAVQLEGTLAVDAGGVTRAVMSMVGDEISYRFIRGVRVDPLLPLFQLCSHSTIFTVVPNMVALYTSEAADDGAEGSVLRRMFEWLGKLMGNMVLCGTLKASFDFPRMLWKTLTFQEDSMTLADYACDIDDNITAALEDEEFVLSDDFFASLPAHVRASPTFLRGLHGGGAAGAQESGGTGGAAAAAATALGATSGAMGGGAATMRPLRPYVCMTPAMSMQDMSHLALEELEEMAATVEAAEVSRRRTLAEEALLHQYDPAFFAIRAGLTSVVPAASLRAVRWEDLRARVCGTGAATSEHVLAELDTSQLPPSTRAMLTEVLSGFTPSQLSRFLLFCSGQSRLPLPERVLVECGDEPGRLPTAHTCSPISLLLQPCSSAAELQRSLEACLSHAAEFGFV